MNLKGIREFAIFGCGILKFKFKSNGAFTTVQGYTKTTLYIV